MLPWSLWQHGDLQAARLSSCVQTTCAGARLSSSSTGTKYGPNSFLSPILWAFPAHLALAPVFLPLTFLSTQAQDRPWDRPRRLCPSCTQRGERPSTWQLGKED